MNVGTLVTSEERMLECIHEKISVLGVLIWGYDQLKVEETVLL
jgi:hypothetical protein